MSGRLVRSVVVAALAVGAVLGSGAVASASGSSATGKFESSHPFYLALGDSLARGVQPDSAGHSGITDQGYVDDVFADESAAVPRLQLVNLGCPGESTTTMITGGICPYGHGSQLAQAAYFLRHHKHNVAFVTIDIGANDVDGCLPGGVVDMACVTQGITNIETNFPVILQTLHRAAGAGTHLQVVGMRYYDPYLAYWLTGPDGQSLAHLSYLLTVTIDTFLQHTLTAFGDKTADVGHDFLTYDFADIVDDPTLGEIPQNVANICKWTWMCAPSPVGPNIHANADGYTEMAHVFEGQIAVP
ncbi:MAG TPA: SGNH/GDSL hydrolase family protein [Actinomycetota bacterium]|nr:SGNH/GDSL hydrolase family protein [Actinomycetota bacterium]